MDKAALAIAAVLTLADEVRMCLERGDLTGLRVAFPVTPRAHGAEALARTLLADVAACLALEGDPDRRVAVQCWHDLAEQLRAIEQATHGGEG
jgi:hypothetical protein